MIFQVTGRGPFPIDMLRYDRCSPASECDSKQITNSLRARGWGEYTVNLFRATRSNEPFVPTTPRWLSFGWTVVPFGQEASYTCLTDEQVDRLTPAFRGDV